MRHIFAAIALFISINSFSQLQVQESGSAKNVIGACKNGAYTQAELSYRVNGKDTLYTLLYLNAEYVRLTDYQSITFSQEGNTLNDLYDVLKKSFSDENKKNKDYKVNFKLGDQNVIAGNVRYFGVTSIMFVTEKGHFLMTEKQLDKIFGRNS